MAQDVVNAPSADRDRYAAVSRDPSTQITVLSRVKTMGTLPGVCAAHAYFNMWFRSYSQVMVPV